MQFQCVPTTYVTENKEENYLKIYIFQISLPLSLPLINIPNCQSVLNFLSLYCKLSIFARQLYLKIYLLTCYLRGCYVLKCFVNNADHSFLTLKKLTFSCSDSEYFFFQKQHSYNKKIYSSRYICGLFDCPYPCILT